MNKQILQCARLMCGLVTLLTVGGLRGSAGTFLVDFGDPGSPSGSTGGLPVTWNDVSASVGASDFGELPNLVTTNGTPTQIGLRMVSRFNGSNESGTTSSTKFPASATRDSLFGNTELFGGLENVTPKFVITGLTPGAQYDFVLYASRTGVSDNRETRYTVTGANEKSADLNVANNADTTVAVTGIEADTSGEIAVALSPGPNNNNANHFTYLGAMSLQSVATPATRLLFDFGAAGSPTGEVTPDPGTQWNNVTTAIGTDPAGVLAVLVTTNGTATGYGLSIVSRFNNANTGGTTASTVFPASATRDSLYGNTEAFNGLANVTPEFKLTGLNSGALYSFTFYASRTGASDNREARYTVTGAGSGTGDLNAANNIDGTVTVSGISPDEAGEIRVRLTPGANNNNANHFIYLGAMRVDWSFPPKPSLLVDFGAATTTTLFGTDDLENHWNNVDATLGGNSTGSLANLVSASGDPTGITLQMISRFNGANANGTTGATDFPVRATQDSLFGNTEVFSGLENVTPIFSLTGLNPALTYRFTFYASRMSVGDNRETRYIVEGASSGFADLNVANNETESARVEGIRPNASGDIVVRLEPGPNNDNGNHFTYLGVMRVDWTPAADITLSAPSVIGNQFRLTVRGTAGKTYKIQSSATLGAWVDVGTITLGGQTGTTDVPATGDVRLYRVVE